MSTAQRPGTGRGGYRRYWTRCVNGHPGLTPDPHRAPLRRCNVCARQRAEAAAEAVRQAAALLSLRRCDYVSIYGTKGSTARQIISRLEAEAAASNTP